MAKATLPTNYQDDVLKSSMNGKRRYSITDNSDGTKCLDDVTQYDKVGSNFGAADMNKTNAAVNAAADASKIMDNVDDIAANTQAGYMMGALAGKQLIQNLGGLNFKEEAGKKYVRGADAVWVPLGNKNLVLMDGNDSYAYVGNSNGYYANFVLSNFDFSGFSKISIRNLSSYSYQVTCGPKVFTSDGTYDISDLDQAKLQVFYRGTNNNGNPPIQIRIELIP